MNIIEYDSNLLIDFYTSNDLEINDNNIYFGINLKSYVLVDNDKIIGAVTVSKYKDVNYIEAIAVDKNYRNNGYGKILLDKVIDEFNDKVYIISKNDKFFLSYGFKNSNLVLIDDGCKKCDKFNVSCFPKTMVFIK